MKSNQEPACRELLSRWELVTWSRFCIHSENEWFAICTRVQPIAVLGNSQSPDLRCASSTKELEKLFFSLISVCTNNDFAKASTMKRVFFYGLPIMDTRIKIFNEWYVCCTSLFATGSMEINHYIFAGLLLRGWIRWNIAFWVFATFWIWPQPRSPAELHDTLHCQLALVPIESRHWLLYVLMREYSGINRLSPLFITHLAFRSFLPIINYARTLKLVQTNQMQRLTVLCWKANPYTIKQR